MNKYFLFLFLFFFLLILCAIQIKAEIITLYPKAVGGKYGLASWTFSAGCAGNASCFYDMVQTTNAYIKQTGGGQYFNIFNDSTQVIANSILNDEDTINNVTVKIYAYASSSGGWLYPGFLLGNLTESHGAQITPIAVAWTIYNRNFSINPFTAQSWKASDFNITYNISFGTYTAASGSPTRTLYMTDAWLEIDYTPKLLANLNITYPMNNSNYTTITELNYTVVNGVRCWYSKNNGTTNSTSVACGTNWTGLTSSAGSNTWILYANDSHNNLNFTTVTFNASSSPVADTCTPPTPANDWIVNWADNCTLSTDIDLGTGNLILSGFGQFTITGNLTVNQVIMMANVSNTGTKLAIIPGGRLIRKA